MTTATDMRAKVADRIDSFIARMRDGALLEHDMPELYGSHTLFGYVCGYYDVSPALHPSIGADEVEEYRDGFADGRKEAAEGLPCFLRLDDSAEVIGCIEDEG